MLFHFALYGWLSQYRENRYLRSRIIGVDIDGVLADHRPQFCDFLEKATNVDIDPEAITKIPVHECVALGVTREQEHRVFNNPGYWSGMPVVAGAPEYFSRLRNELGFRMSIFSYRDWPLASIDEDPNKSELIGEWKKASPRWRKRAIKNITKKWLHDKGFEFDSILIEKGNVYTLDPGINKKNRFVRSAEREIRIFVEDELDKATKLSYICELVFLIKHPYNRKEYSDDEAMPEDWRERDDPELPNNVIPVNSWREIYTYVRSVF